MLLSVVVAPYDERPPEAATTQDEYEESIRAEGASSAPPADSGRRDICINLNLDLFITFAGGLLASRSCSCCALLLC